MSTLILKYDSISDLTLDLGHVGDTGNKIIKFDCVQFFKEAESKSATLTLAKPDGTGKVTELTIDEDFALWEIGIEETGVAGFGEYQLTLTDGTRVLSYPIGRYQVKPVLTVEDPPVPPDDPVDPDDGQDDGEPVDEG